MRHAIVLLVSVLLARGADWRMYLGDLSHTSYQASETLITSDNIAQLQQLWKFSTGGAPIASAVTVADGVLYFGDWEGNFYAIDTATHAVRWSTFIGKAPDPADSECQEAVGVTGQAVVSGDFVYAPGGDSAVYAMNRDTGAVAWRTPLADPQNGSYLWSSLALSGNALFVGIASLGDCPIVRGGLARIPLDNPSSPAIAYFAPDWTVGAGLWSTPAIDEANNLIYVTLGNADGQNSDVGLWGSALLALDATTLEVRSFFFLPVTEEEADADWGSSPTLVDTADGGSYVVANGKNGVMYVLSRPDLSLVWSSKISRDCDAPELGCGSVSTPAFDGSVIYTGAGEADSSGSAPGAVYAFDPASHNLLWSYPARAVVMAPVTVVPGLVFVPTTQGLAVVSAVSGAELWTDQRSVPMVSQAVVSNGIVYTTYMNGDLIAWGIPQGANPTTAPRRLNLTPPLRKR